MSFEDFTDRARKVMQLANQQAQKYNHEYIGPEHLLLALLKEGSGVGTNVLKNKGVDLRQIRLETERQLVAGPEMITMGRLPQTPQAKKVLEFAMEERHQLAHGFVGTEHLLLGMSRITEGVVAEVFEQLEMETQTLRKEVQAILGSALGESTSKGKRLARKIQREKRTPKYTLDLTGLQQSFPRKVLLDNETIENILVVLHMYRDNNLFLEGPVRLFSEYVSQLAGVFAGDEAPLALKSCSLISVRIQDLEKLAISTAELKGQALVTDLYDKMPSSENGNSDDGIGCGSQILASCFLWMAKSENRLILGGSNQDWAELERGMPRVASTFVRITLPEPTEKILLEIADSHRRDIELVQLVKFSSEASEHAVQFALESDALDTIETETRCLEFAGSRASLFNIANESDEAFRLRKMMRKLAAERDAFNVGGKFQLARKKQVEMESIHGKYQADSASPIPMIDVKEIQTVFSMMSNNRLA